MTTTDKNEIESRLRKSKKPPRIGKIGKAYVKGT